MKSLFLLFTLVLTTDMAAAQSFDLENYRWKNRVLLVFAPDERDGLYQRQTALANEARAGYRERDLVVVSVFTESGRDEENSILQKGKSRLNKPAGFLKTSQVWPVVRDFKSEHRV